MNSISNFLVTLFEALGLYSSTNGLGEHLQGLDPKKCDQYTGQSIYNLVFIYLFVINSLIVINYYYGLFNRVPLECMVEVAVEYFDRGGDHVYRGLYVSE